MRKGSKRHRRRPSPTRDLHFPAGTLDKFLRPTSASAPGSPPSSPGLVRSLRSRSASLSGSQGALLCAGRLDPAAVSGCPDPDSVTSACGRSERGLPPLDCLLDLPAVLQPPAFRPCEGSPAAGTGAVSTSPARVPVPSAPTGLATTVQALEAPIGPGRRSWAALLQGLHPSPGISPPLAAAGSAPLPLTSPVDLPALPPVRPALARGAISPSRIVGDPGGPGLSPKPQRHMSSGRGSGPSGAALLPGPALETQAPASSGPAPTPRPRDPPPDTGLPCSGLPFSPQAPPDLSTLLIQLPTKEDFRILVAEVRDACRAEISALRQDLKHVSERVEGLEEAHDSTREYIAQLQGTVAAQSCFLGDLHSHVEDLDNRGRRNNIRVRGLPEATQAEDLPTTLEAIFNMMLGEPPSHRIHLDRAHRALRPRPTNGPPRDVICCVTDFCLKERIMAKARSLRNFDFDGAPIQLYQDLS